MAEQDERWEASIIDAIRHTSERYDALSQTVEQAIIERNKKLVEMEAKIHQNLATVEQIGQRNLEAFNAAIRKDVYATMRGIQLSVLNVVDGQRVITDRLATVQTLLSEEHGTNRIITTDIGDVRAQVLAHDQKIVSHDHYLKHMLIALVVMGALLVPAVLWLVYEHLS